MPTAQNLHPRVQTSPAIMKVAVPLPQQSCMFGHRASSQTVCNPCSWTLDFVSLNRLWAFPVGSVVLNQEGSRFLSAFRRSSALILTGPPQLLDDTSVPFAWGSGTPIDYEEWTHGVNHSPQTSR